MSAHQTLAQMMAEYAEKAAALTAAYEAECNALPTAEDVRQSELRRAEIAAEQIRRDEVAADNAAAIEALELLCPLTAEQVESLPHHKSEYVECITPKFGAVLESYRSYRGNSNRQSLIEWVAVVDTKKLTTAMVAAL